MCVCRHDAAHVLPSMVLCHKGCLCAVVAMLPFLKLMYYLFTCNLQVCQCANLGKSLCCRSVGFKLYMLQRFFSSMHFVGGHPAPSGWGPTPSFHIVPWRTSWETSTCCYSSAPQRFSSSSASFGRPSSRPRP